MNWIRFKQSIAGDRWEYHEGQIVRLGAAYGPEEIPRDLGTKLCDGVRAEPFSLPGSTEVAARRVPEVQGVRGGARPR